MTPPPPTESTAGRGQRVSVCRTELVSTASAQWSGSTPSVVSHCDRKYCGVMDEDSTLFCAFPQNPEPWSNHLII